jgi:DNA-binding winged helix-turn-helix (wHTH) protein/TolB-like protein
LFEFDSRTGELRREGQIVKLSPQPARVLALLLERPGEVVLRDELRTHLWGGDTFVDFERGLNFCILQVRAALGDSADSPRFVQTVPRRGYRFIAPVSPDVSPQALTEALEAPPANLPLVGDEAGTPRRWHWAMAVGAIVILAPVVWLVFTDARPTPPPPTASRIRIAVLPYVNLTGNNDADYLADGFTDALISALGRVSPSRLSVIARTSAMTYRETKKTIPEIGRELQVTHVVEGTVQAGPDGLRVNTNLVAVADNSPTQTWSDEYTRDSATAIRLARDTALRLLPESNAPNLPPPTQHRGAWDAYLKARHLMNRGGAQDVRAAIAELETAVTLDAGFAGGWAQLADAQHLLVMSGAAAPREAYPIASTAAMRALERDESLADAHVARGLVQLWYEWNPVEASRSFERALALNGSHATAHHDYAWASLAMGRDEEAIAHITAARDLDPLSTRANTDIGWLYLQLRRPAEATAACQHALAIEPGALEPQACLERAYLQRGMPDAAVKAAHTIMRDEGTEGTGSAGQKPPATAIMQEIWQRRLERLRTAATTRWISPYTLAVHELLLGQQDQAIAHLEEAVTARVGMLVFLRRDSAMDPIRTHPRFIAVLDAITNSR